ncbi:MAG: SHOCT domain-containing protein [Gammaproteobacteria bacterium]|nr:SHOCT domain-containing protein [Gammaproteobacteria bacterium]
MGFGWILMVLFWGLVIVGIVAIIRWASASGSQNRKEPEHTPLEVLKQRYARGGSIHDEYEQIRR